MAVRQIQANNEDLERAAYQGRFLLNNFVLDQMHDDGIENIPDLNQFEGAEVQRGIQHEHLREIGGALRYVGDSIKNDQELLSLVSRVPPEAGEQTLLRVAGSIFDDGVFNWGRVVALFYFAYKICARAVNSLERMRNVINIIVGFMRRHVIQWIIDNGGWDGIINYISSSRKQIGALVIGALTVCAGAYLYHRYFG